MGVWRGTKGTAVGTFCGRGPAGFPGLGSHARWIESRRDSGLRP